MASKLLKKFKEVKGKSSNGRVKIDCAFCRGEGENKVNVYPFTRTCPACKGGGEFLLAKPLIQCTKCSGSGRDRKDPKVTCIVCKGIGANAVKKGYKVCKQCNGIGQTGESKLPCISCRGAGVI